MVKEVILPRQGNTVESCIIVEWKKNRGDDVSVGDVLCEVETDKATFEVEAEADGKLLEVLFEEGSEVPVLEIIALVGDEGDDISKYLSKSEKPKGEAPKEEVVEVTGTEEAKATIQEPIKTTENISIVNQSGAISPRAKNLAIEKGLDISGAAGSGPEGRIIERDVKELLNKRGPVSPVVASVHGSLPKSGSGIGGRIVSKDLTNRAEAPSASIPSQNLDFPGPITEIPVKGVRKLIAERMHASLASTAQLTLSSSAPAEYLLAYRKKLKNTQEELGLQRITINDLMLFAVSRVLKRHLSLNGYFVEGKIQQFENVHLGFAVDTPKGLMVPVIKNADSLSLKQISNEAKRLGKACIEGNVNPDDLSGGTFTVTNLGAFGIEDFTPVLNAPEVAILGICNTQLKPVMIDGEVQFKSYMGLSLTIDHQVVDGAPGARFLKEFVNSVENIELLLAE